jgi:diguanylate cyclase (GGDEF)-like protein
MQPLPPQLLASLKASRNLPSVPGVALRILELSRREEVSLGEVCKVVQQDPALSAKILRYANSAFLARASTVTSVSNAVSLLGLITVQTLALSFSLVATTQRGTPKSFDYRRYWRRSLLSAVAARALGHKAGLKRLEELFSAALLQDIGMLALLPALGEKYLTLVAEAGPDHEKLVDLERTAFGADHAHVTAWLVKEWRLPELFLVASQGSHGEEFPKEPPELLRIAQCVAVSGALADIWMTGDVVSASARAEVAARKYLALDAGSLNAVLAEVAAESAEASTLVDIDVGPAEELSRVLEEARETLVTLSLQINSERQQLEDTSRKDALTGLFNRAHLDRVLPQAFRIALENNRPLSLVFCDVDHFKKVNDTYGHPVGDVVLRNVADQMRTSIRDNDILARFGGEEFVLILPNTPAPGAQLVCDRIRNKIAYQRIDVGNGVTVQVTASLGFATLSDKARFVDSQELLQAADHGLYAAKRGGRNQVVAYHPALATAPPAA